MSDRRPAESSRFRPFNGLALCADASAGPVYKTLQCRRLSISYQISEPEAAEWLDCEVALFSVEC